MAINIIAVQYNGEFPPEIVLFCCSYAAPIGEPDLIPCYFAAYVRYYLNALTFCPPDWMDALYNI